ncbi:MAG: hypothetical protein M3P00_02330 [Gemmatimonadota bacterium]|nr:hypothetical protein [Gemmatimonadota bacterium]
MGRFGCLLAVVCVAASAWLAEAAFGGGTQVSVVAVAGRVWVTTGVDVVKLNAFTGRVMRRTRTRYPFPIDIGASDGNPQ